MAKRRLKLNQGFTLIEMLVATALFVIVAVVVTGALLVVMQTYRKAQSAKLVIDNLNFSLNQMTLDLREGTNYEVSPDKTRIVFRGRDGEMNAYYTNSDGELISGRGKCDMSTCDNFYNMTDKSQVKLLKAGQSGLKFTIPNPADPYQRVIISLYGESAKKAEAVSIYQLQATVSQRNR